MRTSGVSGSKTEVIPTNASSPSVEAVLYQLLDGALEIKNNLS